MLSRKALFQLIFTSAVIARSLEYRQTRYSTSAAINWGPCSFNGTLPITCGTLSVPLDYSNPGKNSTANLELVRVSAVNNPSKGSILFNFGGPGYEAIQTLASLATYLQNTTGGYHDLIAFNPRGTGNTLPYSCFNSTVDRMMESYEYPLPLGNASEGALGELWANSKVLGNICHEKTQATAELIGTAYVARDMMQIVDSLDEDGLLRYWGFSYGSLIGSTVSAMFPERIDKVLLDGVVNAHNYYHKVGIDIDQLLSADAAFSSILDKCIEAGDLCALAKVNSTALELQNTLWRLADEIKHYPIAFNTTVIDYYFILNIYYFSIRSPSLFPTVAQLILNILTRQNLDAVVDYVEQIRGAIMVGNPEALYGIKGGDTIPRYPNLAGVMPDIEYMQQTSPKFWGLTAVQAMIYAQWPFEAKERYSGDFNVKTKNPILFVGNTWDPATPASSARNMSASFQGSVMFEQHGYGHCTPSQKSACTSQIIRDYFVDGKLPPPDTICEVDDPLFLKFRVVRLVKDQM